MIKCEPQKLLGTDKFGLYHNSRFQGIPQIFKSHWPVIINVKVDNLQAHIDIFGIDLTGQYCVNHLQENFLKRNNKPKFGNLKFLYAKYIKHNILQLICYVNKNNDPIFISYSSKTNIFSDNLNI